MVILPKYKNKKIAIYGMGKTGFSAAKFLIKQKAKIFCWDDNKKIRKKIKKLDLPLSKFWLNKDLVDNIVISPGIDVNKCKIKNYLKKNFSKIITDIDIFFELNKSAKIIAITGTNGKSTTCKIIEKILNTAGHKAKTVGNIGSPILSFNNIKKKYFYILELSSYQLQYSKVVRFKHAAILNISPDHLDRHKNIKKYVEVKSKIFLSQEKSDYTYINSTNKHSSTIKRIFKRKKIKSNLIEINTSMLKSIYTKIKSHNFKSQGNIENLAFAYSIVKKLKINDKIIIKAINNFKGLPHRQKIIFLNNKITCVNDSKATSFDACLQSLSVFSKIYWIVGGIPKKNDTFNINKISKNITKAYIIGRSTNFFVKKIKNKVSYKISNTIGKAVKYIFNDIKKEKDSRLTILFSPGAASYDQFKNFEERGNYFNKLIKKIYK